MGGVMSYHRLRERNGLRWRPETPGDPYPPHDVCEQNKHIQNFYLLDGDWNRFEQDILGVGYQVDPKWGVKSYVDEVAEHAGVTAEQVQAVVRALMEVY